MNQQATHYIGTELELFAAARNWKAYWTSCIRPHLRGDILEVGAGIGANTVLLDDVPHERWVCLEPDANLARQIPASNGREVIVGTLADLDASQKFDAILYIDVMEHIEDDRKECAHAATRLKPGGVLVILSPAHMWLYSPFDKAIGHYRRYATQTLAAVIPSQLTCLKLRYLDSVGLIASLGNRVLLKQSMPNASQINLWDSRMVPISRLIDGLFGYRLGKSVLGIWRA